MDRLNLSGRKTRILLLTMGQERIVDSSIVSDSEQPGLSREDCKFLEMANDTVKLVDGHYRLLYL